MADPSFWAALQGDAAAARDWFVRNMQRASGGGILAEGETDRSARGDAGMALAGLGMTGAAPGGIFGAPAGALGAGAVRPRGAPAIVRPEIRPEDVVGSRSLFDYSKLGETPNVPQTPIARYEPPRGPSARLADAVDDRRVKQGVSKGIDQGLREGGHFWYNNDPLLAAYMEHLGSSAGPEAFRGFMGSVAATSPSSRVPLNVRIASYYDHAMRRGDDFTKGDVPNPPPGYGSKAQQLHKQNIGNLQGGTWDPLQNPKPISFRENLAGNFTPATIDTHAFRPFGLLTEDPRFLMTSTREKLPSGEYSILTPRQDHAKGLLSMSDARKQPTMWESVPNGNEYGLAERFYSDLGKTKGITPAQAQAASWVGLRGLTGMQSPPVPFLAVVDDVVTDSARLMGIPPREMLRRMITAEQPLHPQANARR